MSNKQNQTTKFTEGDWVVLVNTYGWPENPAYDIPIGTCGQVTSRGTLTGSIYQVNFEGFQEAIGCLPRNIESAPEKKHEPDEWLDRVVEKFRDFLKELVARPKPALDMSVQLDGKEILRLCQAYLDSGGAPVYT